MDRPWERQEGEPARWYQHFEAYRLAGPDRSLSAVCNKARVLRGKKESPAPPGTWRNAARAWNWKVRAEAWDLYLSQQAAAQQEAARLDILTSGYARIEERVKALNALAELLLSEVNIEDKRWLPDVKMIGKGEFQTEVDIVHFNAAIIDQFRGVLDDLAAELGQRVRKNESINTNQNTQVTVYIPDNGRNG